jgi:PAS domain S-box-containing protein
LNIWHLNAPERFRAFCEITQKTAFAYGIELPGKVFAAGEPLWIKNVTKNSDFLRAQLAQDIGVKAGFAFPVWSGKEVVAVLEFFSDEVKKPDGALLEIATHIGTQLGRVVERKRVEKVVRESEVKFRALMQAVPESIIVTNSQGAIVLWNKGAEFTFGYDEAEMLGQPLTHLMPQRYRKAYQHGLKRFFSTGKSNLRGKPLELYGLKKDGSEFPLELSLATWKSDGEIFFSGIIRDITQRKQAEEQIIESKRQLVEAQTIAHVGSWSWDIAANELSWSDELHRIYGIKPQDFVASYEGFLERVHGDDRNLIRKVVEEAYDNLTPFNFEHRIVRPDGQIRILHTRGKVVTDDAGRPIR